MGEARFSPEIVQEQPEEPTWKSFPEWKFWLAYLAAMPGRATQPPEIGSFHHVSDSIRTADEKRVRKFTKLLAKEAVSRRERREKAGKLTDQQRRDLKRLDSDGPSGLLIEQILTDLVERFELLGGVAIKTTKFDDYFNAVDVVIEWPFDATAGTYPRLAVDFTVSNIPKEVGRKRHQAAEGRSVRYFRSHFERDEDEEHGKQSELVLPGVVINVTRDEIKRLGSEAARSKLSAVLADHPIRRSMILQVKEQLIAQSLEKVRSAHPGQQSPPASDRESEDQTRTHINGLVSSLNELAERLEGQIRTGDPTRRALNKIARIRGLSASLKAISEQNVPSPII